MPTGFPFVIPGLRTALVADLFQGYLLIKAPGGTNLYMDLVSDATEEYYASTPCTYRIASRDPASRGSPHTPLLRQTEPKQPQRRFHRNLKVLGCHTRDRNHVVFMELTDRWMDVKDHMDAHMVCEQRPSANSDEGR